MGRKILFITTDQQRYDALGCNGGTIARTPVIDALSRAGITFDRAHPQNVVCMPSRSTMLTGQHVSTHGVWMNGVPLPEDAPSIADVLQASGVAVEHCETIAVAVKMASERAASGDVVLLSPACASFDQFKDYIHRAAVFVSEVEELGMQFSDSSLEADCSSGVSA